jgi:hypothetical protein
VPTDFGRSYLGIDKMSSYIMEDWCNFLVYFGPVMFGNELEVELPDMAYIWGHLRAGLVYYLRGSSYEEGHMQSPERLVSRGRARDSMMKAAAAMEEQCPASMLTLNLRLVTVHAYAQEDATGAIDNTLEWWNERAIGQVSRYTPELTVAVPEVVTVNGYLLRERLDDTRSGVNDLSGLAAKAFTDLRASSKEPELPAACVSSPDNIDFLDKALDFKKMGDSWDDGTLLEALGLIQADAENTGQLWKSAAQADDMEVGSYTRCAVSGEVYTSLAYTRATARASYHVVLRDTVSTAAAADVHGICQRYATVTRYCHVRMISSHASVAKLALVKIFQVDPELSSVSKGFRVVMTPAIAPPRLVHMAEIRAKCIIHLCAVDKRMYAIDLVRRLSIARE